uniref:CAP-Gly domain-containing protein n=1 Tax=Timema bartmani TaxID=61472 RepID=A0A7R9HVW3_9NEOP|nr:unnamed protein product [Timema bartmani]
MGAGKVIDNNVVDTKKLPGPCDRQPTEDVLELDGINTVMIEPDYLLLRIDTGSRMTERRSRLGVGDWEEGRGAIRRHMGREGDDGWEESTGWRLNLDSREEGLQGAERQIQEHKELVRRLKSSKAWSGWRRTSEPLVVLSVVGDLTALLEKAVCGRVVSTAWNSLLTGLEKFTVVGPAALELVQSNLAPRLCHRQRCNRSGATLFLYAPEIFWSSRTGKLELVTGGAASTMQIEVYDKENKLVCKLTDDMALLGSYPIDDGMRMHAFLLKNKLGKYNEEETKQRLEQQKKEEQAEETAAKAIALNSRCETRVPGFPTRRGTVMFVGQVEFAAGWWIGIKYDEPLGKNDGSVSGKRYFSCQPKYGGFVKPAHVTFGEFPEESTEFDEM